MDRAERRRMKRETKGGAAPPKTPEDVIVKKMIVAEHFALVDKAGHPRGGMVVDSDGTANLALQDNTEQIRAALLVTEAGAVQFCMTDREGSQRITLQMDKEMPMVLLADKEGVARLRLSLSGTGSPQIFLMDRSGKERLILAVDGEDEPGSDHNPAVVLCDKDGQTRAGLALPSE
jgi:hypothetical protein